MSKRTTTDESAERLTAGQAGTPDDGVWAEIEAALRGLQFGSVSIVVQDGLVVQIDRTEKRRPRQSRQRCN